MSIHFPIKNAVIHDAPNGGFKYYVVHPQNDAILAYVNSADEANEVVASLEKLATRLEGKILECNFHTQNELPKIGEIIEHNGAKYRAAKNSIEFKSLFERI